MGGKTAATFSWGDAPQGMGSLRMLALAPVGRNVSALQAFKCLCVQALPDSVPSSFLPTLPFWVVLMEEALTIPGWLTHRLSAPFSQSRTSTHGMVLPTFRVSLQSQLPISGHARAHVPRDMFLR